MSALVSLVGAGPGDPSLITPSSVLALHHADVVVGDSLVHRALLALAPTASVVDQRAIVRDDALDWAACAHLVCAHARAGKRVCWLLSTSSASRASLAQIAELLQIEGVETEVNPGLDAVFSAVERAGVVVHHVRAAQWTVLDRAPSPPAANIFVGDGPITMAELERGSARRDPSLVVHCIEWCFEGAPRVVTASAGSLVEQCAIAGVHLVAAVVVAAESSLRRTRAAPTRSLAGLNVAITRPRSQQAALAALIRERGAQCWEFSAISLCPPPDPAALLAALDRLNRCDVLAFTSANGVDAFFESLAARSLDARGLVGLRVAAIGRATCDRLRQFSIRPDIVASEAVGESLADAVIAALGADARGARVMLVRAARGRETVAERLRSAGITVELALAYDTMIDPSLARLRPALEDGSTDALCFYSGSAIDAALSALGDDALRLLSPVTIATIGPVTSDHARRVGLPVHCEAREPSDRALVEALEAHFAAARR